MKIFKKITTEIVGGYKCDTCGVEANTPVIEIIFGYGHHLDGEIYHFCSYPCLLTFFNAELKKEK